MLDLSPLTLRRFGFVWRELQKCFFCIPVSDQDVFLAHIQRRYCTEVHKPGNQAHRDVTLLGLFLVGPTVRHTLFSTLVPRELQSFRVQC